MALYRKYTGFQTQTYQKLYGYKLVLTDSVAVSTPVTPLLGVGFPDVAYQMSLTCYRGWRNAID